MPSPGYGAGCSPNHLANPAHIQLQRNTSPLTTLNAWLRAAPVVAAHSRWRASSLASVMSVRPFHCTEEPGNENGRPVSAQIVAYAASVTPMFIALPTA